VRQWHGCPELWCPIPGGLKARLDGALGSLSWWGQPAHGRGWNWMGFKVPPQPKLFYDSKL